MSGPRSYRPPLFVVLSGPRGVGRRTHTCKQYYVVVVMNKTPSPSPPLMGSSWGASACGRPDAHPEQQQADDQGPTIKAQADQEARRERPGWKASERGPGGRWG